MEGDEGPSEASGPRTWIVLLGTVVAAAVVIGGIFGFLAWRDDSDEPVAAPSTQTVPVTTAEAAPAELGALLFRRTTEAGIEVRARRDDGGFGGGFRAIPVPRTVPASAPGDTAPAASVPGDTDSNGLPDFCDIVGNVSAWAIDDDTVVQGGGPITRAPTPALAPSVMFDGQPAGSIMGVVMQVGDDVATVRLTAPDGGRDEMEPVEGVVVLAVPVPPDLAADVFGGRGMRQFAVSASHADGTTSRAAADAMERGHPAWSGDPACVGEGEGPFVEPPMPELTLPPAGPEQPADPAAARAEIEATFGGLYGPPEERTGLVDDNYGLEDVRQQILDNGFGDAADGAEVTITELVFTSPTEAVFSYDLVTPISQFRSQLGRARLLDDTWKITRATLCQDLSKAGVQCPP